MAPAAVLTPKSNAIPTIEAASTSPTTAGSSGCLHPDIEGALAALSWSRCGCPARKRRINTNDPRCGRAMSSSHLKETRIEQSLSQVLYTLQQGAQQDELVGQMVDLWKKCCCKDHKDQPIDIDWFCGFFLYSLITLREFLGLEEGEIMQWWKNAQRIANMSTSEANTGTEGRQKRKRLGDDEYGSDSENKTKAAKFGTNEGGFHTTGQLRLLSNEASTPSTNAAAPTPETGLDATSISNAMMSSVFSTPENGAPGTTVDIAPAVQASQSLYEVPQPENSEHFNSNNASSMFTPTEVASNTNPGINSHDLPHGDIMAGAANGDSGLYPLAPTIPPTTSGSVAPQGLTGNSGFDSTYDFPNTSGTTAATHMDGWSALPGGSQESWNNLSNEQLRCIIDLMMSMPMPMPLTNAYPGHSSWNSGGNTFDMSAPVPSVPNSFDVHSSLPTNTDDNIHHMPGLATHQGEGEDPNMMTMPNMTTMPNIYTFDTASPHHSVAHANATAFNTYSSDTASSCNAATNSDVGHGQISDGNDVAAFTADES